MFLYVLYMLVILAGVIGTLVTTHNPLALLGLLLLFFMSNVVPNIPQAEHVERAPAIGFTNEGYAADVDPADRDV